MRKFNIFLVVFALLLTTNCAFASIPNNPDWHYVVTRNGISYNVDMNNIKFVSDNIIVFWIAFDDPEINKIWLMQETANVKTEEGRHEEIHLCDINGNIEKSQFTPTEWNKIEKNSIPYLVLGYIVDNYSKTKGTTNNSNLLQVYTDNEYGFSFCYPRNWEKGDMYNTRIAIFAPPENNFRANMNVVITAAQPELLKTPKEFFIEEYKKISTNFNLLDFEKGKLLGRDILVISYISTINDETICGKQYLVNNGKNLYVITFSCLPSNVSKYEKVFDDIVDSIIFR